MYKKAIEACMNPKRGCLREWRHKRKFAFMGIQIQLNAQKLYISLIKFDGNIF